MTGTFFELSCAVAVIVVAGTILTWCADSIAEHSPLSKLFVGSVFLAIGTSLPELMTGLNAVWLGLPDLAVGDLLGSCLFNLLILAVLDLAYRSRTGALSRIAAAHSLAAMVTISLAVVAAIGVLTEPKFPEMTLLGMGPAVLLTLLAYLLGIRLIYADREASAQTQTVETPSRSRWIPLRVALLGYLLGAVGVTLAAPSLAECSGRIAELTGVAETFIGSTLVALTTSLPELVATIVAVRIGAVDLAAGNIFGSNALNIALLAPLDWAFPGSLVRSLDQVHVITCLATVLVTAVIVMGQLYRVERRIGYLEPDAIFVMLLIVASLGLLYLSA